MFTAILLFILFAIFAMLYLESFWSNSITLINVTLAALLAMSFFEPAAAFLDAQLPSFTYLWDYLMLWAMFCIFFGILRGLTDFASRTRVKFRPPIEIPGRMLAALAVGLVMVSFIITSFHVAPLPAAPFSGSFGYSPDQKTFLFFSPDRTFLSFVRMTSKGSLSASENGFDPNSEYVNKYRQRRRDLEDETGLRVNTGA